MDIFAGSRSPVQIGRLRREPRLQCGRGERGQRQVPGLAVGAVDRGSDGGTLLVEGAPSQLGRQVVAVRVEVRLGAVVGVALAHRLEPRLQVGPGPSAHHAQALVVRHAAERYPRAPRGCEGWC